MSHLVSSSNRLSITNYQTTARCTQTVGSACPQDRSKLVSKANGGPCAEM